MENSSKKYNKIKLRLSIAETILSFMFLLVFMLVGLSNYVGDFAELKAGEGYLSFIIYCLITGAGFYLIFLPFSFYSEYILEHKYNLSNQNITKWIKEELKGLFVGGLIGLPVISIFYYVLHSYGSLWWLPFAIIMFFFSVILAQIAPILILPLFYKLEPIEDEGLNERIRNLASRCGFKFKEIYKFDLSKNTKKANAAFTGFGKSRKIILGDTLLENFSYDEIETVLAHEIGHFRLKHILKNILISTVSSFLVLYLISYLFENTLPYFGLSEITDIRALPILLLAGMIIGLVQTPITNMLSRKFEYEADRYAVINTGKYEIFADTLTKLTKMNLGDEEPHPFVEWYYYSHPSVKNRIRGIQECQQKI